MVLQPILQLSFVKIVWFGSLPKLHFYYTFPILSSAILKVRSHSYMNVLYCSKKDSSVLIFFYLSIVIYGTEL